MLIIISLLILAYMIMGKDIKPLLERVKNIDWRGKINALMDKLRPWALKAGRAATRPLLQFFYVMADKNTSTLDRVLINLYHPTRRSVAENDIQIYWGIR